MNEEDKIIRNTLDQANEEAEKNEKHQIYFDPNFWLRDCKEEVTEPIEGKATGKFPEWLAGSVLRNGPGKWSFGESTYQHLFDVSALIHRYEIKGGKATYQCRFLPSKTYKTNEACQRIVFTQFGTRSVPDPCQTIFQRFMSIFQKEERSDNCSVSIYPMGDELYAYADGTPFIHRLDPVTLDSLRSVNLHSKLNIVHHSSHPHVTQDGTVYNVGLSMESKAKYTIISFPKTKKGAKGEGEDVFDEAQIVSFVPSRWSFNPSYMHSFGITDNYFLIIEQPFCLSMLTSLTMSFTNKAPSDILKWYDNEDTLIHVISRETGTTVRTFHCETFFFFHTINQYEEDDHVVFDLSVFRDGALVNHLFRNEIMGLKDSSDGYKTFRARPVRFVLPMKAEEGGGDNLVSLEGSQARSWSSGGQFWAKPELLSDLTVELPRVNYPAYNGKKYRYFYGLNTGMDEKENGAVIKVDTLDKSKKIWSEEFAFASEPIFVPAPNAKEEDEGVVLVSLIFGGENQKRTDLLVLDAKTMKEVARTSFDTPMEPPSTFHGWFTEEGCPLSN